MSNASQFLKESRFEGYPIARFENVGDRVSGTVTGRPRVVENSFGVSLVIDLANAEYPEGGRAVFVRKGGQMASALAAASDNEIAEGAMITITLLGERDTGKGNPLKVYEVTYEAPQAKVDIGSLFEQES